MNLNQSHYRPHPSFQPLLSRRNKKSGSAANSKSIAVQKQAGFCLRLWSVYQHGNWTLISALFAAGPLFLQIFPLGHDSHFLSFHLTPQVIEPLASYLREAEWGYSGLGRRASHRHTSCRVEPRSPELDPGEHHCK